MTHLLRIAPGFVLCAAAGLGLLSGGGRVPRISLETVARAGALGIAVTSPALVLLGLAGLPVTAVSIAAVVLAFASLSLRRGVGDGSAPPSAPSGRAERLSSLVPAGALLVFAGKIVAVPLWCWDHYVVWGMKSRALWTGGILDLTLLQARPFSMANSDYPLGLPMAWRVLTLGAEPVALDFKICHVLFGIGVVLAVRQIVKESGALGIWADAAASFVAVSPLFWDTESLGIAEMPLAWFALTALGLALRLARSEPGLGLAAGAALGFLPWVKKEGTSLAVLLLAGPVLLGSARGLPARLRRARPAAGIAAAIGVAAVLLERRLLPRGLTSFFAGDWSGRLGARIRHPIAVLAPAGRELLFPAWLGFWLFLAAGLAFALRRRRSEALAAFGVVLGQAALYLPVYFATYLDPAAHIRASLFRLLAALLPIGAVGIALAAGAPSPQGAPEDVSAS